MPLNLGQLESVFQNEPAQQIGGFDVYSMGRYSLASILDRIWLADSQILEASCCLFTVELF